MDSYKLQLFSPLESNSFLTIDPELAFRSASIQSTTDELKKVPVFLFCFTWLYITIWKEISVATSVELQILSQTSRIIYQLVLPWMMVKNTISEHWMVRLTKKNQIIQRVGNQ